MFHRWLTASAAALLAAAGGLTGAEARPDADAKASDRPVVIEALIPAGAEIWFDDDSTNQKGEYRRFISPPLTAGREFHYKVHVRWTQDGLLVDRTQRLAVHAGDRIVLDYARSGSGIAAVAYETDSQTPLPGVRTSGYYNPAAGTAAPSGVEIRSEPAEEPKPHFYDPGPRPGPPGSNDPLSLGVGDG
jgi:uncharacterized protein (TIGR03000 family)